MFRRITQNFLSSNFVYSLHRRMRDMYDVEKKLSTMRRFDLPEKDPVGAVMSMDYKDRLYEISVYTRNLDEAIGRLNLVDSNLASVTDILQRIRELAVQGANGTYTNEDRQKMAREVDELLRELVHLANAYYKDTTIYSGANVKDEPFMMILGRDSTTGEEVVQNVRYFGNEVAVQREIDRKEFVPINIAGHRIFWSKPQVIIGGANGTGYVSNRTQVIRVDGKDITIEAGDDIETIARKINESGVAVHAFVDNSQGTNRLVLEATTPHQITLEDIGGGTVLSDLGIIDAGLTPPNNYSPTARVYGGSLFDAVISLRNHLVNGDTFKIGGDDLHFIDEALNNILEYRAEIGARTSRMQEVRERLDSDRVFITEVLANVESTDIPEAVTELNMLELAHKTALNVGSRIIQPTLLDFLR